MFKKLIYQESIHGLRRTVEKMKQFNKGYFVYKFILIVFSLTFTTYSQSFSTLWKARGIEATERIDSISKSNKVLSFADSLQINIEKGFVRILDDKRLIENFTSSTSYHLLIFLNNIDDGLEIVYTYKADSLYSCILRHIPKNWQITLNSEYTLGKGSIIVQQQGVGVIEFKYITPFYYSLYSTTDKEQRTVFWNKN